MIPFLAALSIALIALLRAAVALSIFLFVTADSTLLVRVLIMLLIEEFLSALFADCFTLLRADPFFFGADLDGTVSHLLQD